jgi:chromosome segregation ATPase
MIEEAPMSRVINYVPRLAIFAAGIMAGVLTSSRRERGGLGPAAEQDLKRSIADLESRLEAHESADNTRFAQVETRLDEHAVKLADVPSTAQIVAAMEQLLSKTMMSLDERLTTQAHSIEALKTTVTQTDSLLERVLESLDSLQTYTDPAEFAGDSAVQFPTN